ncbi:MAG TPA: sigma-54 dependent transcriptional regulator [Gemmatimonadaceae bacterium]|nr:sigma-54 dependent transcriptional regulator [Gemmatimonadaceae bacterium]
MSQVMISLTDVEPAVRLNALLESEDVSTVVVSPIDDLRGTIARERPEVLVFTGALTDPSTLSVVREQLWGGASSLGLSDIAEPAHLERLRTLGYAEVFAKPANVAEVGAGVRRALERRRLQQLTGLFGESEALREVLVQVELMAPVSSTVLIEGESGTGKELVARALHRLSPRRNRPFIAVNVGALPETLLESELLGHEKGAFTGAAERRLGRFELANTGTIFLDEIGEVPSSTQVKLLRVLEERELTRLGGSVPIPVDVRVIAATNRPLREHVEEGSFRADLYYRLNVLRIYLPPLRQRPQDIPLLVRRFIQEFARAHDRPFHGVSAEAMALLAAYAWPGNVRELRNLVESMVVLSPGHEIQPEDLPLQIRGESTRQQLPVHVGPIVREQARAEGRELEFILRSILELKLQVEELRRQVDEDRERRDRFIGEVAAPNGGGGALHGGGSGYALGAIEPRDAAPPPNVVMVTAGTKMADVERAMIEATLRETRGNRRRAAELLGIGERTLYRKIKEYRVQEAEYSLD